MLVDSTCDTIDRLREGLRGAVVGGVPSSANRVYAELQTYRHFAALAERLCEFSNWMAWTSYFRSARPSLSSQRVERFRDFRIKVQCANWPGKFEELERAIDTLSLILVNGTEVFLEHAVLKSGVYVTDAFYHRARNESDYQAKLAQYTLWEAKIDQVSALATKSANWSAECIRRDIDPGFYSTQKFAIQSNSIQVLEFTDSEKAALPAMLTQLINP